MKWPWTRDVEPWEVLIVPPRRLYAGADEALRARTKARREQAQRIRERAARVEAGEPLSDQIRRVR